MSLQHASTGAAPRFSGAAVGFLIILTLLMLAGALKQTGGNTLDPDVFWHMRVAQQLSRDGIGPLLDDISFNSVRQPWTPYSWLAELVMERAWRWAGLRGAVVLSAALIAATIVLLAFACHHARRAASRVDDGERGEDGLFAVLLATAVGMFLCLRYLTLRPVTMAFVVIVACVALLLRDRRRGERSLMVWLVPPLVALGINFHFFTGIVALYIACLLAGSLWEPLRNRDSTAKAELSRRWRRYALLTAAALVACAVTPMFRGMMRTVLHYHGEDLMVGSGQIIEFGPFYRGAIGAVSALLVGAIVVGMIVGRERMRAGEVLGASLAGVMILMLGRLLPVFAFVGAPLLAVALPAMPGRLLASRIVWAFGMAAVLFVGYRTVASLPRNIRGAAAECDCAWLNRLADTKGYPCEAADYVLAHIRPRPGRDVGRVINEFGWGGYLSWRLRGRYRVLLDGRTQLYPDLVWRQTYLGAEDQLAQFLDAADADVAVISKQAERFEQALRRLGWRVVYEDARSRVFLPNTSTATAANPAR